MCIYIYTHIYTHMYTYVCIYVYMYICIYVYMYVCMYVFMYVCMYVCMEMEWNGMQCNAVQCSAVQCNAMQLLVLSFSLLFLYYYDYLLLSLYNIVSYVCLFLSFCTLVGTHDFAFVLGKSVLGCCFGLGFWSEILSRPFEFLFFFGGPGAGFSARMAFIYVDAWTKTSRPTGMVAMVCRTSRESAPEEIALIGICN